MVHDIAEPNPGVRISEADSAPCPEMTKGPRIGSHRPPRRGPHEAKAVLDVLAQDGAVPCRLDPRRFSKQLGRDQLVWNKQCGVDLRQTPGSSMDISGRNFARLASPVC